jgi:hypothetical protein
MEPHLVNIRIYETNSNSEYKFVSITSIIQYTCIIALCSKAAKLAFDVKYPPLLFPGIMNSENQASFFSFNKRISISVHAFRFKEKPPSTIFYR